MLKRNRYQYFAIVFVAISIFAFQFYKATIASFTYDESSTYIYGIQSSLISILGFSYASSNNHIINTILMKLFSIFFGNSEIVLRLPNLIAFSIYLYFSFLIVKKIEINLLFPSFLIMVFNPFMLDYFSLARGYGLTLGFTVWGVYSLLMFFDQNKIRYLWKSLIIFSIAVVGNFSFLYFYLAILTIVLFSSFFRKEVSLNEIITPIWKISLSLFLIISYPIIKLIKADQLYHGGSIGFWSDTINTLVNYSFYNSNYHFFTLGFAMKTVLVLFIIFLVITLFYLIKNKKINISLEYLTVGTSLLLLIFIGSTLSNYLFSVKYLIGRTAIFLVPVFLMCTICLLALIYSKMKIIGYVLSLLISGLLFFHTYSNLESKSFYIWKYDMNTEAMLRDLDNEFKNTENAEPIVLSISWLFASTVSYYIATNEYSIKEVRRKGDFGELEFNSANYFYLNKKDLDSLTHKYKIVAKYDETNTYLIKTVN